MLVVCVTGDATGVACGWASGRAVRGPPRSTSARSAPTSANTSTASASASPSRSQRRGRPGATPPAGAAPARTACSSRTPFGRNGWRLGSRSSAGGRQRRSSGCSVTACPSSCCHSCRTKASDTCGGRSSRSSPSMTRARLASSSEAPPLRAGAGWPNSARSGALRRACGSPWRCPRIKLRAAFREAGTQAP